MAPSGNRDALVFRDSCVKADWREAQWKEVWGSSEWRVLKSSPWEEVKMSRRRRVTLVVELLNEVKKIAKMIEAAVKIVVIGKLC